MHPFDYARPESWDAATAALAGGDAAAMGGGTDLVPLMRDRLLAPARVVDLRGVSGGSGLNWDDRGTLTLGAATTLREIASHARVRSDYAALAQACEAVGSYALRNMGTLGGNLCQHVRCWYFRQGHTCLRTGGARCSAQHGENQYHAIFPQGPCVAVHPSDPAVALCTIDATAHLFGPEGARSLPISALFARSQQRLDGETTLAPGELLTAVSIPEHSSGGVQFYEKVMQRAAWDFALVSIAGARRRDGSVRLVLGGVANTPWRVPESIEEDVASGGLSGDDIETLAQRALYDAEPLAENSYKLEIAGALLRRAMAVLATP